MRTSNIRVKIPICIEPDGDEFHAFAPALKGCHVGGATVEEAKRNLGDALHLYLSAISERSVSMFEKAKKEEVDISNIINSPEWIQLKAVIVAELKPYPEAKAAVLAALERVNE